MLLGRWEARVHGCHACLCRILRSQRPLEGHLRTAGRARRWPSKWEESVVLT